MDIDAIGRRSHFYLDFRLIRLWSSQWAQRRKKNRDELRVEDIYEWCCVPSLTHMHSQSWGSAVDALNAT